MNKITQQKMDELIEKIWRDFLSQASAEQLYQSIVSSNWDDNEFLRTWILTHDAVDQAVVLAMYWMAGPRYAKQFVNRADVVEKQSWYIENFDFIEQLESRYLAYFWKKNTLAYDPRSDHHGYDWFSEYNDLEQVLAIPLALQQPLQGQAIIQDESFEDGLPDPWLSRLWALFDEYDVI